MRRFGVLVMVVLAATMTIGVGSAAAFEGGGRTPGEAPLVTYGQHYTGTLDNRAEDSNYGGLRTIALWKIPPLLTHDQLVVNWHELPFAHDSDFPVSMMLSQGVNEYDWGSVFHSNVESSGTTFTVRVPLRA